MKEVDILFLFFYILRSKHFEQLNVMDLVLPNDSIAYTFASVFHFQLT
jgi:hypothetical protein